MYELLKDEEYYVNYKLIKKCNVESWDKILNENLDSENFDYDDFISNNDIFGDNEENFNNNNKKEFN